MLGLVLIIEQRSRLGMSRHFAMSKFRSGVFCGAYCLGIQNGRMK